MISTKKTIIGMVGSIFILVISQVIAQLVGSVMIVFHLPVFLGNMAAAVGNKRNKKFADKMK